MAVRKLPSKAASFPAPVGGWNKLNSLAEMPITDAVTLTNFFPTPTSCRVRLGYTQYSTFTGQCESIFYYNGGTTKKWFGAVSSASTYKIYDMTSGGAVGAAVKSGLTNARFQYTNIATTGGTYISLVNGADKRVLYDGTTWTQDGDGTHDITGVDTATLIGTAINHNRQWFIQSGTLKAYYLGTQAISGAATAFDMSAYAPHGGKLVSLQSWTIDGGAGMNDLLAFFTSNGDVIVWQGTDPASSTTWSLFGVYWLGAPIGNRSTVKYKGDIAVITQDGIVPMAQAFQSTRLDPRVAISEKIQYAVSEAVSSYSGNFGWQILPFPKENMLILNVPVQEGSMQQQYVMNTITGSWCNFTGWNANCWELINDEIYFGGNGFLGKAWSTYADNGSNITAIGLQAFSDFGNQGVLKRFTMMRPTVLSSGSPAAQAQINVDFDQTIPTSTIPFVPTSYGVWDTGLWGTALWGSDSVSQSNWQGANGLGYWGAPIMQISSQGINTEWVNTTVVYEPGAIL